MKSQEPKKNSKRKGSEFSEVVKKIKRNEVKKKDGVNSAKANDGLLYTFCVPYNHIRPMNNDDELKDVSFAKDGDLKKTNTGSMFPPYVGCAVLVLYSTINHPAKITQVLTNGTEICSDVCGSVNWAPYTRMIPVLDNNIPCVNPRKYDQFHYIPNCDNSQLEYLLDERVYKHPSCECSSTILDSLLCHGRNFLKNNQRPLTHRQNHKRINDEVVAGR